LNGAENPTPKADNPLRDSFLGWQCRIRQMSVRQHGGYPLPGMRPRVSVGDGSGFDETITVLVLHRRPEKNTDMFRHMVKRTQDPLERHEAAVKMLSAVYYQYPGEFSDVLTALFSAQSGTASALLAAGRCMLTFEQSGQTYRLPCRVTEMEEDSTAWQGTFWHNHLFNPEIPPQVSVLAFTPDWDAAEAEPTIAADPGC